MLLNQIVPLCFAKNQVSAICRLTSFTHWGEAGSQLFSTRLNKNIRCGNKITVYMGDLFCLPGLEKIFFLTAHAATKTDNDTMDGCFFLCLACPHKSSIGKINRY